MFYLSYFLRFGFYYFALFFFTCNCWGDLAQETIYLTWQRTPSTTMTIQWISPYQEKEKQSTVVYRPRQDNGEWLKAIGGNCPFPQAAQYLIHRMEISDLQPNTEYTFKLLPYEEEYHFLTAPEELKEDIRFVVGGDMYHDGIQLMAKTCQTAAETNPLFALIGGDIAYAVTNLPPQKIERWIEWIKAWHANMVTPQGHLIPVIAAIGNHDIIGQYDQTPAQAAVFSALFPMPGNRIYNVLDFNSYLSIFILDSGHANPIAGQQTMWLSGALDERQQTLHRFAVYHVPAYPSVRHFQTKQSVAIRSSWVPLFEKGGIQMAFEHHDHAYKRTHPLLNNRIHPQGIVYLGDGGWGVEQPRKFRSRRSYLAKFASVRHFIAVTLTPYQQSVKCINDQGQIMDEYTKPLKPKASIKEAPLLETVKRRQLMESSR